MSQIKQLLNRIEDPNLREEFRTELARAGSIESIIEAPKEPEPPTRLDYRQQGKSILDTIHAKYPGLMKIFNEDQKIYGVFGALQRVAEEEAQGVLIQTLWGCLSKEEQEAWNKIKGTSFYVKQA